MSRSDLLSLKGRFAAASATFDFKRLSELDEPVPSRCPATTVPSLAALRLPGQAKSGTPAGGESGAPQQTHQPPGGQTKGVDQPAGSVPWQSSLTSLAIPTTVHVSPVGPSAVTSLDSSESSALSTRASDSPIVFDSELSLSRPNHAEAQSTTRTSATHPTPRRRLVKGGVRGAVVDDDLTGGSSSESSDALDVSLSRIKARVKAAPNKGRGDASLASDSEEEEEEEDDGAWLVEDSSDDDGGESSDGWVSIGDDSESRSRSSSTDSRSQGSESADESGEQSDEGDDSEDKRADRPRWESSGSIRHGVRPTGPAVAPSLRDGHPHPRTGRLVILEEEETAAYGAPRAPPQRLTPSKWDSLTKALFSEYNGVVFKGALPADLPITWNARLTKTAGLTYTSRRASPEGAVHLSRVELSVKVCDTPLKLASTLLHELCHAAAWVVDHVAKPPHGRVFRRWAAAASRAYPARTVTTCHSYDISYKHVYVCVGVGDGGDGGGRGCGAQWGRHSKSIDTSAARCGRCRGKLIDTGRGQLTTAAKHAGESKGATTAAAAPTPSKARSAAQSAYQAFLREKRPRVATMHPGWTPAQVLAEVGRLWTAAKGSHDSEELGAVVASLGRLRVTDVPAQLPQREPPGSPIDLTRE